MHSDTLPEFHYIGTSDDDDDDNEESSQQPGDHETDEDEDEDENENQNHNGSNPHTEYQEDDREEQEMAERLYAVAMLRQTGIDWIKYPQYSTHILIVLPDIAAANGVDQKNTAQVYNVMDQFLISASAIFRDLLLFDATAFLNKPDATNDTEEDQTYRACQQERMSCVRILPQPSPGTDPAVDLVATIPSPDPELPSWIFNLVSKRSPAETQSAIELRLPRPEHFPALLKAIYDGNLDHWEQATFTPATIALILQNVMRLECSTSLTIRCLEYYRSIRHQINPKVFEDAGQDHDAWQRLREMYDRALESGILT